MLGHCGREQGARVAGSGDAEVPGADQERSKCWDGSYHFKWQFVSNSLHPWADVIFLLKKKKKNQQSHFYIMSWERGGSPVIYLGFNRCDFPQPLS